MPSLFIISRDTDFDPLMEYLQRQGQQLPPRAIHRRAAKFVPRRRCATVKSACARRTAARPPRRRSRTGSRPSSSTCIRCAAKPSTRKTLVTTIGSYFKQHGGAARATRWSSSSSTNSSG